MVCLRRPWKEPVNIFYDYLYSHINLCILIYTSSSIVSLIIRKKITEVHLRLGVTCGLRGRVFPQLCASSREKQNMSKITWKIIGIVFEVVVDVAVFVGSLLQFHMTRVNKTWQHVQRQNRDKFMKSFGCRGEGIGAILPAFLHVHVACSIWSNFGPSATEPSSHVNPLTNQF